MYVDMNASTYVQQRLNDLGQDYDKRIITKIYYAHDIDCDIAKHIDYFWNKFK